MSLYIGQLIWKNMKYCNMSVKELADILGVSRRTVYYWLNGEKEPSKKHMDALYKLFCVSEGWNCHESR